MRLANRQGMFTRMFPPGSRRRKYGLPLLAIIIFYAGWLICWEILSMLGIWPEYAFPPASMVIRSIQDNFANGRFIPAIVASLRRLAIGYTASLGIGLGLGVLMGRSKMADVTIGSVALGFQALPSIAWLPLALIWFGLDEMAIIFVIIMGVVFSVAISTSSGIRSISSTQERAARNLGARHEALILDFVLPAALPHIVSGMKQGWSFAWRALIAAEMVYSAVGLGHMLMWGKELNDLSMVLAVMAVIIIIGLAADQLLFNALEKAVHRRWGLGQRTAK